MNDALIIQQVYPGSEYTKAVALTLPKTLEYATAHNFDYEFYYGEIASPFGGIENGGWAKILLLLNALERGYQYAIWMDADSLIADMDTDLRAACPENGIGFVPQYCPERHLNTGNIYVRRSDKTMDLLKYWLTWFPGPQVWHEQAVINLLSHAPRFRDTIIEIDSRFNSCRAGNTQVDNPAVEAFHGEGSIARRLSLMRRYMKGKK